MIREEGCVFCEIADKKKPADIVFEDDKVLAILSNAPTSKGQIVILCKEHYVNLFDMPLDLAQHMLAVIKKIAPGVVKAMGTDSYILGMNNGPATRNHVDHAHMHIVPRHMDDDLPKWPDGKYAEGESELIKEKIIKSL
ncbi:HIT family protein [Candidatus Woesearchaeota archaeon]|nr:HIT family protein [Candidatus Woesearchaeota archaeon]